MNVEEWQGNTNAENEYLCKRLSMGVPTPYGMLTRMLGERLLYCEPANRNFTPHLIADGYWEIWLTNYLIRNVRPGMTCVDVGCYIGYYTVLMADLVGNKGCVYAFDPNVNIRSYLVDNIAVNGMRDRVIARVAAVGAMMEQRPLFYSDDTAPCATLIEEAAPPGGPRSMVTVRPLDAMCPERVDFVKVDAEGMDGEIWQSARQVRERNPLCTFVLEYDPKHHKRMAPVVQEALQTGHFVARILPDGGMTATDPYDLQNRNEFATLVVRRQ